MKAIIMAGGKGTRLMPMSARSPKPMTKLMGLPLLEHIIELLRNNGFTELCMTLGHMPEQITDYFGNGEKFGVSIEYRIERKPLGTAGGVRSCADFFGDDDFLVISGDAACDFDLKYLAEHHTKTGADVTMALYRHSEPMHYGTVLVSEDCVVRQFIEKPTWDRVVTDMVNTGIYVVSSKAMKLISIGVVADFAKDLFPMLMKSGDKMFGVQMEGYWCDIGNAKSYHQCCMDALDGQLKLTKKAPGDFIKDLRSFICYGTKVDRSSIVAHSIVHAGGKIAANSRIIDSVVDGGEVGEGCFVDGTVVCRAAVIDDNSTTKKGDVVAAVGISPPRAAQEVHTNIRQRKRGLCRELVCSGRAALMHELSGALWEIGADFSDGITFDEGNCRVHISPMEDESAIAMEAFGGKEKERILVLKKYFDLAYELDRGINSPISREYSVQ